MFSALVRWNSASSNVVAPLVENYIVGSFESRARHGVNALALQAGALRRVVVRPLRGYSLHRANYGDYYNQSADFVVKAGRWAGGQSHPARFGALGEGGSHS